MASKTLKSQHAIKYIYLVSNTYYMTIHGSTIPIPIYRGTLQGDTLSPFLFTICMQPLLRWLSVGSRGYIPTYQTYKPASAIITYDDHGYVDDIGITAGSIRDLNIYLKALNLGYKCIVVPDLLIKHTSYTDYGNKFTVRTILSHPGSAMHFKTYLYLGNSLYNSWLFFIFLGIKNHYIYLKTLIKILLQLAIARKF